MRPLRTLPLLAAVSLLAACRQDMHDQPRFEPLEASSFFADGRASRPQVEGTIARGELQLDDHLYRGKVDGEFAETFPFEITEEVMERGQERFDIYCSPCHGRVGNGEGMIVERGLKQPPSYHIQRLQEAPPGYFFDVITHGFGAMYDLSDKISVRDRWAIVAYIRALQLSQNASLSDVPEGMKSLLEGSR
ncbi:MAG TPA: cytochrome c [Planctomycetes bacterium]|nr:cytochrome c [Planctomycetota bacterium]